ncbi:G1 family glutamic endopeptidase [Streptomyces sp. NPDC091279]|uniref:G1 family glutamic endopeptidase n=1 Tax=Streptomyces sp. NPDC091279 TaxID=3365983 RepID=UPI00380B9BEC
MSTSRLSFLRTVRAALPSRVITVTTLAFALAAAPGVATAAPATANTVPAASVLADNPISLWGGYVVSGKEGDFDSVSAEWTEPEVTCNSTDDAFARWVGLDGWDGETVEQQGVAVQCATGTPVHRLWWEMFPDHVQFQDTAKWPIQAGDHMLSWTSYEGDNQYRLLVGNLSRGWEFVTVQTLAAKNASAEAVIESGTGSYPQFDSVGFTDVYVNGKAISTYGPLAVDAGANGIRQARTEPLKENGTDFDITFVHE